MSALRAIALAACAMLAQAASANDNVLLIQQGPQGFVVWHGEGDSRLDDDTALELMASALPEGGPRLRLDGHYAKAFIGRLGVTVTQWLAPAVR